MAFEALYDRYWEKFYTISYWNLSDQESAKDLVQELFVDLWVKRKQIDINKTVEGYLKIAIRNRVFNLLRSRKIKEQHIDMAGRNMAAAGSVIEEQHRAAELKKLYHQEIQKLPSKMKEVYLLVKEDSLSITEAAQKLSLSEQTVKNQLGSALKKIRSGLEHYRQT